MSTLNISHLIASGNELSLRSFVKFMKANYEKIITHSPDGTFDCNIEIFDICMKSTPDGFVSHVYFSTSWGFGIHTAKVLSKKFRKLNFKHLYLPDGEGAGYVEYEHGKLIGSDSSVFGYNDIFFDDLYNAFLDISET
jgi:hypothetical protein